jgi:hypothetical protein
MKVRINNIGAEPVAYIGKRFEKPKHELSIVKYHPNKYYGELENYLKDGWEDKGAYIKCKCGSIDKDCFKNKETNYVIAFLRYDSHENTTKLESVCDRLLYIEEDEKKDFFEVYKIADRMIMEKVDKDELADFGLKLP